MFRLRDEQWERIREHFPEEHIPESRPGRKPVPARDVLEAALWILNTGAQWHMLPQCSPSYKMVQRRFQQWCEREVLREILIQLANTWHEEGEIDTRALHRCDGCLGQRRRRGNRENPAWQRREDPRDCGSPWAAALGEHTCGQSS